MNVTPISASGFLFIATEALKHRGEFFQCFCVSVAVISSN
jgi:hypothetical protein